MPDLNDSDLWHEDPTSVPEHRLGTVTTMYADRRWGRGQTVRLIARRLHSIFGHDWSKWRVEAPESWDTGFPVPMDVEPETVVMCFRGCLGDCGAVQTAITRFRDVKELPT